MSILETKELSFVYGENTPYRKDAITNINVAFEQGELVGIIGHTGSGKSTLVQCLNGLLKPSGGTVLFGGEDVHSSADTLRSLRFKVGLVFQYPEYQLFDNTVFDDISYGPKNMGISGDELKKCVFEAAETVGLDMSLMNRSPFELSGGQKRRAAIAGVIAMKPQVLILDEPTAGLDPRGRAQLFEMIKKYRDLSGSAVIVVSHSMEDIAEHADKVLVMQNGGVLAFGETDKVFSDAEALHNAGLSIPQITRVFLRLKKMGIDVPGGIYSVKNAVGTIESLLKGKEGKNA